MCLFFILRPAHPRLIPVREPRALGLFSSATHTGCYQVGAVTHPVSSLPPSSAPTLLQLPPSPPSCRPQKPFLALFLPLRLSLLELFLGLDLASDLYFSIPPQEDAHAPLGALGTIPLTSSLVRSLKSERGGGRQSSF